MGSQLLPTISSKYDGHIWPLSWENLGGLSEPLRLIEVSLGGKLLTVWTDEKQSRKSEEKVRAKRKSKKTK